MSTLIVAFPKIEEAKAVRSLLVRRGYDVAVPCTSGAQAINQADNLSEPRQGREARRNKR